MIKIATWNIGEDETHAGHVVTLDSYDYIKEMIVKNDIDIICLQESITSSDRIVAISNYISENTKLCYYCDFELSHSHINTDCMMGVSICSRFPITHYETVLFCNPNIEFKEGKFSQDKGFIIAHINELPLVIANGHCFPFKIFQNSQTNYVEIYKPMDEKLCSVVKSNSNVLIVGDMNYCNVEELFPEVLTLTNKTIFGNTYKDRQLDHMLLSKTISCIKSEMIPTRFDHQMCIITICEDEL